MSAPRLLIITTRLPPAICGIGTYSWRLREHWPNEQWPVEFLALGDCADPATQLARTLERIGAADGLLHYAGRAYQRYGLPFWMPRLLTKWKRRFPQGRLGIFFHEMPGRFPITSRHFWLGQASVRIIRRLAASADVLLTNTENHLAQLYRITGRRDIHLLPVGSNIQTGPLSPDARARTEFLVFGLPFGRQQTLQAFAPHLRRWQADGLLTKLHLAGPGDNSFAPEELLVRHGTLDSEEVAQLLRRVGFALTNVSEQTWGKSSAFMACAANECPVVIAGDRPNSAPLCRAVAADEVERISNDELEQRTTALAEWYRAYADWPVIAARLAAIWPLEETP